MTEGAVPAAIAWEVWGRLGKGRPRSQGCGALCPAGRLPSNQGSACRSHTGWGRVARAGRAAEGQQRGGSLALGELGPLTRQSLFYFLLLHT